MELTYNTQRKLIEYFEGKYNIELKKIDFWVIESILNGNEIQIIRENKLKEVENDEYFQFRQ